MTRGGENRGRLALATHNAGSCHGSIFPFLFLPSLPPAVAPAAPKLPFLLLDLQLHIPCTNRYAIACILAFSSISLVVCFDYHG